jgi:hypothetical protein
MTGTPTGTVQFRVDGHDLGGPVVLVNGRATSPAISTLSTGRHTVTADYSGSSRLAPSTGSLVVSVGGVSNTRPSTPSGAKPAFTGANITKTIAVALFAVVLGALLVLTDRFERGRGGG